MSVPLRRLCWILAAVAVLNFVAFDVHCRVLGGSASGEPGENGVHLVRDHGRLAPVSPTAWAWSRAHAVSVFVTHPLGILAGLVLWRSRRRRSPAETAPAGDPRPL